MIQLDRALQVYESMLKIRMVEEAISQRYKDQKMRCPVHLSVGQEAVASAFSTVTQSGDFVVSTHRAHAHFLAKGGSIEALIGELHGKSNGCSKGVGGSMHLADSEIGFMGSTAIVGNSIPVGVGLGLACKQAKADSISFVFLGDGATEEGAFYESLNFAAVRGLPVLFIVENNLYSVFSNSSMRHHPNRDLIGLAHAIGLQASRHDGNDAVECIETLEESTIAIRNGSGPALLEFETYRQVEHCGPENDDHLGYRPQEEILSWRERDPIPAFESRFPELIQSKALITRSLKRAIDSAFEAASEARPLPKKLLNRLVLAES